MTFKQFMQLDEDSAGLYGSIKAASGDINLIKNQIKLTKPVKGKGTSISRMMSAGTVKNPARPARLFSPTKPMTVKSSLS